MRPDRYVTAVATTRPIEAEVVGRVRFAVGVRVEVGEDVLVGDELHATTNNIKATTQAIRFTRFGQKLG
jgi:hypothetical protein